MTLFKKLVFIGSLLASMVVSAQVDFFDFDRPGRGRGERVTVNCNSGSFAYNTCYVGNYIVDAYVSRQISRTRCIEGENWGFTNDTIWVDKGCRADFVVTLRGGGHHRGESENLVCASGGYRFNSCYPQNPGRITHVELVSQHSRTSCVEGDTWGWDYSRIWVDKGCRAEFRVYLR